jgi:sodium transport system permease protein
VIHEQVDVVPNLSFFDVGRSMFNVRCSFSLARRYPQRTGRRMNWSKILLILHREIRDQLRDRRTLFMIFVLPVLLYPIMGVSFLQLAQFSREQPTTVRIIGREQLPEKPRLIETVTEQGAAWERFAKLDDESDPDLLRLDFPRDATAADAQRQLAQAEADLKEGLIEAVVYFPPDFAQRLEVFRRRAADTKPAAAKLEAPKPEVLHNTAKKKSSITHSRVRRVLAAWRDELVKQNLVAAGMPEAAAVPFEPDYRDVADARHRFASAWSVAFPFMMLIWALTGAFYPAIDICAGEKERGTLETLLSSPAERGEIVCGKLLTVMIFSVVTVALNLLAVAIMGWFMVSRMPEPQSGAMMLGPPPFLAFVWVFLAVIPVSALFSALCLALAAFARSNKEGQYYLMPLFLITLPLVALPMSPGFELTLGNSLLPLTGIMLILKAAIEGDYLEALRYFLPVTVVTGVCCLLAVRWAIDQFNKESVLFRESERFELGLWLRHLVRDRRNTPTVATAILCGVVILSAKFFLELAVAGSSSNLVTKSLVLQLAVVLAPAVLMTAILTRSPRQTLLLRLPPLWTIPAVLALAVVLHPVTVAVSRLVQMLYPVAPQLERAMEGLFAQMPSIWTQLLVIAVVGPLCEEIAFRGFILSGFRHLGRRWMAILLASIFFGITHGILQQSIVATLLGLGIGFIAVQTRSLLPAVLYHMAHNALAVCGGWLASPQAGENVLVGAVFGTASDPGFLYSWAILPLFAILALWLLRMFARLPDEASEEERLVASLRRQTLAGERGALAP